MPQIVKIHEDAQLARDSKVLPQGETSGRYIISIPFSADYIAIQNLTQGAILYYTEGEVYNQGADATPVEPGAFISTRIRETQKITVFWTSATPTVAGDIIAAQFSNEPIPMQAGAISPNSTASNVKVVNAPIVSVDVLPDVVLNPANPLPVGANEIGKVVVSKINGDSFANYSAANAGAQIKTGAGTLKKVVINNPGSAMIVELYDALDASNPIGKIAASFGSLEFNIAFATGLFVVISGTTVGDVTISYQ